MGFNFKTGKDIEKYLKTKTDKEFILLVSSEKTINIIICRNDKLLIRKDRVIYLKWIEDDIIEKWVKFIDQ